MKHLAKEIYQKAKRESYSDVPNQVKHRLQEFQQTFYANKMLKNKKAIRTAVLPEYLSFFKENKSEPVKYHLEAFKTGDYDLKEEEE